MTFHAFFSASQRSRINHSELSQQHWSVPTRSQKNLNRFKAGGKDVCCCLLCLLRKMPDGTLGRIGRVVNGLGWHLFCRLPSIVNLFLPCFMDHTLIKWTGPAHILDEESSQLDKSLFAWQTVEIWVVQPNYSRYSTQPPNSTTCFLLPLSSHRVDKKHELLNSRLPSTGPWKFEFLIPPRLLPTTWASPYARRLSISLDSLSSVWDCLIHLISCQVIGPYLANGSE